MRTITINKSTPDRAGYVSYALAAAFHDDPVFAWCVPDEERRRAMLPRFFNLVSRTLSVYDEIYEADDAVGAALWIPPGEASIPFGEEEHFGAALPRASTASGSTSATGSSSAGSWRPQEARRYGRCGASPAPRPDISPHTGVAASDDASDRRRRRHAAIAPGAGRDRLGEPRPGAGCCR